MFGTIFDDLYEIGRSINSMFDIDQDYRYTRWPAVNIYSNNDEYVIAVKIPGMKKEDISLVIKDNTLKISGERKKGEYKSIHLNERYSGKFEKNILLNEKVDSDKIEAQLKNGILLIKLPKSAKIKPKSIAIK
jgi:HSP20 family protein